MFIARFEALRGSIPPFNLKWNVAIGSTLERKLYIKDRMNEHDVTLNIKNTICMLTYLKNRNSVSPISAFGGTMILMYPTPSDTAVEDP